MLGFKGTIHPKMNFSSISAHYYVPKKRDAILSLQNALGVSKLNWGAA